MGQRTLGVELGGFGVDEGAAGVELGGFGVELGGGFGVELGGGLGVELGGGLGVELGGGLGVVLGGLGVTVVTTVLLVVVVARAVYVSVRVTVPVFKILLQNSDASALWSPKASKPQPTASESLASSSGTTVLCLTRAIGVERD
jgi:hypothetical protein